jgi:hypothetical protein
MLDMSGVGPCESGRISMAMARSMMRKDVIANEVLDDGTGFSWNGIRILEILQVTSYILQHVEVGVEELSVKRVCLIYYLASIVHSTATQSEDR